VARHIALAVGVVCGVVCCVEIEEVGRCGRARTGNTAGLTRVDSFSSLKVCMLLCAVIGDGLQQKTGSRSLRVEGRVEWMIMRAKSTEVHISDSWFSSSVV
jgi:hypothetical protein